MKRYKFKDPDGDMIQFDGPEDATPDEIGDVLDQMYAKKAQKPKAAEPKSGGVSGYLASAADLAAGMLKFPVQAGMTIGAWGKSRGPANRQDMDKMLQETLGVPPSAPLETKHPQYNLDELWKAAGDELNTQVPTVGAVAGVDKTPEYNNIVQRGLNKVGEFTDKVGDVAGEVTGSKDVAGAVKIGANLLPIPGTHVLSKALKRKPKTGNPKLDALDDLDQGGAPNSEPTGSGTRHKPKDVVGDTGKTIAEVEEVSGTAYKPKKTYEPTDITDVVDTPPTALGYDPLTGPRSRARATTEQAKRDAAIEQQKRWEQQQAAVENTRALEAQQQQLPLHSTPEQIAEMRARREGQGDLFNDGNSDLTPTPIPDRPVGPPVEGPQGELPFGPIDPDISGFKADQFGAHDAPGVLDENGMPIRPDLSMEAANLENPLQQNLWGDELGPALGQERSLTDSIDQMNATGRTAQGTFVPKSLLEKKLGYELPADKDLAEAVAAADKASGFRPPRGQRGGINLKEIAEGLAKLARFFVPEKATMVPRSEETILGKTLGKDYSSHIPVDETVEQVLNAAKQDHSRQIKFPSVQAGSTMAAHKTGSGLILGVSRWWQNASKRTEYLIRQHVLPVEQAVYKLPKQERTELADVFRKEMFRGTRYSVDQLQQAGFSDRQIQAHMAMANMFDKNIKLLNEGRAAKGLEPVTPREAYLSSRWGGPWKAPVYDAQGRLKWYIAEQSRGQAKAAEKWMKANFPDLKVGPMEITELKFHGRHSIEDAFASTLDLLDRNDPIVKLIKEKLEEHASASAYNSLGQPKHFETKGNIRGFLGDKPWLDPHTNAKDLFDSQFTYAKNSMKWSEHQTAMEKTKQVLADEDLGKQQPKNIDYVNEYVNHQIGRSENAAISMAEHEIAKGLGVSRKWINENLGNFKSLWVTSKLFGNLGYTVNNVLQALISTPAFHAELSGKGVAHSALKTTSLALKDTAAALGQHWTGMDMTPMTPLGRKALEYLENNSVIDKTVMDETGLRSEHGVTRAVEKYAGKMITGPDKFARLTAFFSYVHHLDQGGAFKGNLNKLFQKAEELQNASMVDPRVGETATAWAKFGVTGRAFQTLQNYQVNYLNQLSHFMGEASRGNGMPLAVFLAMQGLAGGAMGLPFVHEIDDLVEKLKDYGVLSSTVRSPKRIILESGDGAAGWITDGPLSKLSGMDVGSRFTPNSVFDRQLPFARDMAKIGGSVADVLGGDVMDFNEKKQNGLAQLGYQIAPPVVQGLMETGMDQFKIGDTPSGNTKFYNPNKLTQRQFGVERTPKQIEQRRYGAGLRSLEEAKTRDLSYVTYKDEKRIAEQLKAAPKEFYLAVRNNDEVAKKKLMTRYISNGGDPTKLVNSLSKFMLEEQLPPEVQQALRASTQEQLMKIQRIQKVLKRKLDVGDE